VGRNPHSILPHDRRLLVVPGPNDDFYFPKLQFNADGTVVQGLELISKALRSSSHWALLNFLVTPQTSLEDARPIDRLRAGAVAEVVDAAGRVGEQGY
jgi:hypothetical protein